MKTKSFIKTLESLFVGLGLSEKEARVYRVLLEIGEGPAVKVISKSGLKRGITYAVLKSLEKRGLVKKFSKESRTFFRVEDPQKLLDLVEEKSQELDTLRNSLKEIVPKLTSHFKLTIGKPMIRYFEGETGLKQVFDDVYSPEVRETLGCVDIALPSRHIYDHIISTLMPRRIKNKTFAQAFDVRSPQAQALQKHDKEHFREIFLVDGKKYPMPAEIDVYQDKIAFLSFVKDDFIGVIIENKAFAETLRTIFKIAFDLAKKEKRRKDKDKIVS